MSPELTRMLPIERIGDGLLFLVEANPEERCAVADRMGLVEIKHLSCSFDLTRPHHGAVRTTGILRAQVVQTCVVSLEPFETAVEEAFAVRFVPEGAETDELDLEAEDEIPYAGHTLDLGEATAEQLALALDPFPRKPGAILPEADSEAETRQPFAVLQRLRRPD